MKKLLSILFIIMLIITLFQIRASYALYKDTLAGEYASLLGKWSVKVNDTDIVQTNGQATKFEMPSSDMEYVQTSYIAGNGIAPGSEGSFYLTLDSTESKFAVKYSITIDPVAQYRIYPVGYESDVDPLPPIQNLSTPFTFEVLGVEDTFYNSHGTPLQGETYRTKNKIDLESNSARGILPLDPIYNIGCKNRVKVTFRWVNDDENTALQDALSVNEKAETELKDLNLIIPIRVNLYQYLGGLL